MGFLLAALISAEARASVIAIGAAGFPAASQLIQLTGLATGTEVNGLTVEGVQFSYSLGNGSVVIGGGPGMTNDVNPPDIVSVGASTGTLTVRLPTLAERFGFGYAILTGLQTPGAATIAVFSGATALGSLSYLGIPDPLFAGGFAGLISSLPFDRVEITFSSGASAFALDNIRVASAQAVPEPSTWLLLACAVGAVALARRPDRWWRVAR